MGEVYLGHSPAGDPVAVKLIRSDRLDPVTRARFEKEALIARSITGTNRVARFLDADPFADRPWLAIEFIPGSTLHDHVDAHGPLTAPLVASLGALLAEGLRTVHSVGLLHRDLKPQNVIMGRYGPVVIDFGLGAFLDTPKDTISHSGMIIGTVRCMPPEQAGGHPQVTPAADVYGLGAVLLYAATGHYAYDGGPWQAIVTQVVNPDCSPNLTGLPTELLTLVSAMLAHDPERRPSLERVIADCAQILADAGLSPADARYALIQQSLHHDAAISDNAELPVDAPSVQADAAGRPESPLDRPPAAVEPDDSPEASTPEPRQPSRPQNGRLPASRRVAEELRRQYDRQASLL